MNARRHGHYRLHLIETPRVVRRPALPFGLVVLSFCCGGGFATFFLWWLLTAQSGSIQP